MVDARRVAGLLALACALLLSGCTPDGPAAPSPSPTPAVQSPTETSLERQQRLDYAAAEKAYRTFRAEFNRVLRAGGSTTATPVMKENAGGSYLKETLEVAQAFDGLNYRTSGPESIVYVRPNGYSESELQLAACEDGRKIVQIDKAGKRVPVGEVRVISLQVRRTATGWKVWSGTGKKVTSCS